MANNLKKSLNKPLIQGGFISHGLAREDYRSADAECRQQLGHEVFIPEGDGHHRPIHSLQRVGENHPIPLLQVGDGFAVSVGGWRRKFLPQFLFPQPIQLVGSQHPLHYISQAELVLFHGDGKFHPRCNFSLALPEALRAANIACSSMRMPGDLSRVGQFSTR